MIPIPPDFKLAGVHLDQNEAHARDSLNVSMHHWARFRHAVAIGNLAENLQSTSGIAVSPEKRSMYCDFGRNHYDYICSIAAAKEIYTTGDYSRNALPLHHHRLSIGFYNQLGSALDALSRIIYILVVPDASTAKKNSGRFKRHFTDWKDCRDLGPKASGFAPLLNTSSVDPIREVRNQLTHGWMPIARIGPSKVIEWPLQVTNHRDLPWPHDPHEKEALSKVITAWIGWRDLFEQHYIGVETIGEKIFEEAVRQLPNFEAANDINIQWPSK